MKKTTIILILSMFSVLAFSQKEAIDVVCLDSIINNSHCSDCPIDKEYVCGIEIKIPGQKNKQLSFPVELSRDKYKWKAKGYNGTIHVHYESHYRFDDFVAKIRECKGGDASEALVLINDHVANDLDLDPANELIVSSTFENNIITITDTGNTYTFDLSNINTDNQQIESFDIVNTSIVLELEDGGTASVDLIGFLSIMIPQTDGTYVHGTPQTSTIVGYQLALAANGDIQLFNSQGVLADTVTPMYSTVSSLDNSVTVNQSNNNFDLSVVSDSTRLTQDSILIYYQNGLEIDKDTIRSCKEDIYLIDVTNDVLNCSNNAELKLNGNVVSSFTYADANEVDDNLSTTGNIVGKYTTHNIRGEWDSGVLNDESNADALNIIQEVHITEDVTGCERSTNVIVENYNTSTRVSWKFGNNNNALVNREDKPFATVQAAIAAMRNAGYLTSDYSLLIETGSYFVGTTTINATEYLNIYAFGVTFSGRLVSQGVTNIQGAPNWIYETTNNMIAATSEGYISGNFNRVENTIGRTFQTFNGNMDVEFINNIGKILIQGTGTVRSKNSITGKYAYTEYQQNVSVTGIAGLGSETYINIDNIENNSSENTNFCAIFISDGCLVYLNTMETKSNNNSAIVVGNNGNSSTLNVLSGKYISNSNTYATIQLKNQIQGFCNLSAGISIVQNGSHPNSIEGTSGAAGNFVCRIIGGVVDANKVENPNITVLVGSINTDVNVQ